MAETGTQNITEVTEASSIATGDNIYLNHSNQLQQIDYDKLATAILNKLSTQSFSSLETTAKTVLGGINELNSKSYLLQGGTAIPNGSDMNNYDSPGNYYVTSSSTAQSFANTPFTNAFTLKVEYANGTAYPCQTFTEFSSGKKAWRLKGSSGWNDYVYFSDDAALPLPLMNNMRKIHTGWIRVAKYQAESTTVAQGSKGYGALLTIKSFYSNRYPVYYLISFHAGHQTSGFTIIDSYKGNGILQKIRHTVDVNTDTAYIELNISDLASENNSITVTILDNINGYGDQKWEPVNAESTDESVSGVTVISSLSLQ